MNPSHISPDNCQTDSNLASNYQQARAIAADAIDRLAIKDGFTIESIQAYLEDKRNRKIVIREMSTLNNTEMCGLWFGLEAMDLVIHAATETDIHRQQIILHEFSHILLDHEQDEFRASQLRHVFPDLDGDTVIRALGRGQLSSLTEISAEILADLLAEKIRTTRFLGARTGFDEVFG